MSGPATLLLAFVACGAVAVALVVVAMLAEAGVLA